MAKRQVVKGATSKILEVFIQDSSSLTGDGLTGLAYNSSGLTAYYHRNTSSSSTAVTLVNMTVGTFASGGFKEVDSSNMPGVYQFCLPDAAYASGADSVSVILKGAANMVPLPIEIELTGTDNQDAVRFGLTALPNASAGTSSGLPSVSDVNAQVLDVLTVDTFAQPGQEAPAATNTLAKMIGYLFKAWRNKTTQTSDTYSLFADDGTTVDQKATTTDDGTTFTRAEIGTGP